MCIQEKVGAGNSASEEEGIRLEAHKWVSWDFYSQTHFDPHCSSETSVNSKSKPTWENAERKKFKLTHLKKKNKLCLKEFLAPLSQEKILNFSILNPWLWLEICASLYQSQTEEI